MEQRKTCTRNEDYEVSNTWRVRRWETICRITENNSWYPRVFIRGTKSTIEVHRLVAEAWIPNPEKLRTVNHISWDKTDNSVWNLERMSYSNNRKHAHRTWLHKWNIDNTPRKLLRTNLDWNNPVRFKSIYSSLDWDKSKYYKFKKALKEDTPERNWFLYFFE